MLGESLRHPGVGQAAMTEVPIIQEYCTRGDLRQALQTGKLEGQEVSEDGRATAPDIHVALMLALDVASAMEDIHSRN
eukprot:jgi/Tetstr1/439829/TSEL_028240.t1